METIIQATKVTHDAGFIRLEMKAMDGKKQTVLLTVREAGKLACEIVGTPEVKNEIMTWGNPS